MYCIVVQRMWNFYKILPYIKGKLSLIENFKACFIFRIAWCICFFEFIVFIFLHCICVMHLFVFPLKYCNVHIELRGHRTRKVTGYFDKASGNLRFWALPNLTSSSLLIPHIGATFLTLLKYGAVLICILTMHFPPFLPF